MPLLNYSSQLTILYRLLGPCFSGEPPLLLKTNCVTGVSEDGGCKLSLAAAALGWRGSLLWCGSVG